MLDRREFMILSAILAAGATITLTGVDSVLAIEPIDNRMPKEVPLYRFHGHAKSGCAFRPEITDIWAGGGAVLPEEF
ncbi:MAG: hypothetical protein R3F48_17540 [Candidatus Zixiibacteriota bacterium]